MDVIFAQKELDLDAGLVLGLDFDRIIQITPEILEVPSRPHSQKSSPRRIGG